ncbi:MAG: DNA-directed RNA polymerase subunit L [Candidatus Micrarchaeota archaeon]|nr:DNA-directed RNA polymerase subunit L [Candidatus Micrarchaeota archaeon]
MKLNFVVDEKNHIEVQFIGEEYSIPAILKDILNDNKDVEFVTYVIGHPSRDPPLLVLKTKKNDARKVLKEALKEAITTLEDIKSSFSK